MPQRLSNTFEAGGVGDPLTAAATGGASGDVLTLSKGPTSLLAFTGTAMHGSVGVLFDAAANESAFVQWPAEAADGYSVRGYFRFDALPTANQAVAMVRSAVGTMGSLTVTPSGRIRTANATGAQVQAGTVATLAAGTWYRYELVVARGTTTGNGRIEAAVYAGDATSPLESLLSTTANTGTAQATHARYGRGASSSVAWAHRQDSIALLTGSLAFIGPGPDTVNTGPVVTVLDPAVVAEPFRPVEHTVTVFDPEGGPFLYEWTVDTVTVPGALTTANLIGADGPTVSYTMPATLNGVSITLRCTVEDPTGRTGSATVTDAGPFATHRFIDSDGIERPTQRQLVLPAIPLAPTAVFTGVVDEATVLVDATASTDGDGTLVSYAWDFGDGTTASGVTATHTYATGTYTITLTVTDNSGLTSTATKTVKATAPVPVNVPPTASFSTTVTNLDVAVDASASTDPDGSIVTYAWDFGDGATATGVTASHTYTTAGAFTVTLTVTDDSGLKDTISTDASVAPPPPPPIIPLSSMASVREQYRAAPAVTTPDAVDATIARITSLPQTSGTLGLTLTQATAANQPAKVGDVIRFDGNDRLASASASIAREVTGFTIAARFKVAPGAGTGVRQLVFITTTGTRAALQLSDGVIRAGGRRLDSDTGVFQALTTDLRDNTWHVAAVSFDYVNGTMSIYQDGVLGWSGAWQTGGLPAVGDPTRKTSATNATLHLGATNSNAEGLIGDESDVVLFNDVVSAANHAELVRTLTSFNAPSGPTLTSLTEPVARSTRVEWTAVPGATEYRVYEAGTTTGPVATVPGTQTWRQSGQVLTAGATYTYSVSAVVDGAETARSNTLTITLAGGVVEPEPGVNALKYDYLVAPLANPATDPAPAGWDKYVFETATAYRKNNGALVNTTKGTINAAAGTNNLVYFLNTVAGKGNFNFSGGRHWQVFGGEVNRSDVWTSDQYYELDNVRRSQTARLAVQMLNFSGHAHIVGMKVYGNQILDALWFNTNSNDVPESEGLRHFTLQDCHLVSRHPTLDSQTGAGTWSDNELHADGIMLVGGEPQQPDGTYKSGRTVMRMYNVLIDTALQGIIGSTYGYGIKLELENVHINVTEPNSDGSLDGAYAFYWGGAFPTIGPNVSVRHHKANSQLKGISDATGVDKHGAQWNGVAFSTGARVVPQWAVDQWVGTRAPGIGYKPPV